MAKKTKKKIADMSVAEILDEIGGIYISDAREFYQILPKEFISQDETKTIYNEALELQQGDILNLFNTENPLQILLKRHEEQVNKRYLILLTLYNKKKFLENLSRNSGTRKEWERDVKKACLLLEADEETFEIVDIDDSFRMHVINSKELTTRIKRQENLDNLAEPSKKQKERFKSLTIPLNDLVNIVPLFDIIQFGINDDYGKTLLTICCLKAGSEHLDEPIENDTEENDNRITKLFEESVNRSDILMETIEENLKYIDIDKMLLIIAFNLFIMLERNYDKIYNFEEIKKYFEEICNQISSHKKSVNVFTGDTKQLKKFTKTQIEMCLEHFKNGKYITQKDIENLRKKLMSNEITLPNADRDVLRCIDFTEEELKALAGSSEDNLVFLVNILTYEDIIKLLEDGKLAPNSITKIEDELMVKEINDEAKQQIREMCAKILEFTSNEQNEQELPSVPFMYIGKFAIYATIFRDINILNKGIEEAKEIQDEFIGELIAGLTEDIGAEIVNERSNEILQLLYQYGLIDLGIAKSWGMDTSLMTLKPADLRSLYLKGEITVEDLKKILAESQTLNYEQKIDLIYSTFELEEKEIVDELLKGIDVSKTTIHDGTKEKIEYIETTALDNKTTENKGNHYVVSAHIRWKMIVAGDKDCSMNFLQDKTITDGHRVFLLPNRNEVIIEKLHDKTKEGKKDAYGAATYIIPTEVFFNNIDGIIIRGGQINRTFLRILAEEEEVALKLNHDKSWGNALKQHFGIDERQPELNAQMDRLIVEYRKQKERDDKG